MDLKRSLRCGAGTILTLFAVGLAMPAMAEMSSAVQHTETSVAGLQSPAEIIVDYWGIPHIYADNDHDALFLQGYNAARDRLWQIDLWRKRGLGLLSESFGPDYVEQDRAARLFLYRGDMDAEWKAYGDKAKGFANAFVDGVNAYVQEVLDGKQPLPVEFRISGSMPSLWAPEDVVSVRSHGLTRNVSSEVRRAQVVCAAGLDADRLRSKLEPDWTPTVPDGLDPCTITTDILKDYNLGTQPVSFKADESGLAMLTDDQFLDEAENRVDTIGSNNWVVGPDRTTTGRPILANDPHRDHGVPSLRYIVGLTTPDMSVIGAGEPALPGISIGHNEDIAFGLTIFAIDQEDLYVYDLNPDNPDQYKYGDGWEDMKVVEEQIPVKGQEPQTVQLKFTRHGPVLKVDEANHRAFAMRSVWLEPGTSAYFGSADYMTAHDWDGFLSAMNRFAAPSENQVYADVDGNIGWVPAGMTPKRTNWDGLLPVPGDGRYEWGFFTRDDLPSEFNPKQGFFASANQMNLPPDYPINEKRIGFEWSDPSRFNRITEVLSGNDKVSLLDSMKLQNDDNSTLARRLIGLTKTLELPADAPANVASALDLIKNWDGTMAIDSDAATLSEIWLNRHLGKDTVDAATPDAAHAIIGNGSPTAVLDLLENPDDRLGSDPSAGRDKVLVQSLTEAVAEVESLLGTDQSNWDWGRIHHAEFAHALEPLADPAMQAQMHVGPLEMSGASSTPHAASYNSDFQVTSGASFRMVLDVGNWDASQTINTPGESGNPYSPHYRDLAPYWATGAYVPLLYTREAVEKNAAQVMSLTPAK